MRNILFLGAAILLLAGSAFGQAGGIGLYADTQYVTYCCYDVTVGPVSVYVVHRSTPGATASQFLLVNGGGFSCAYTGETSPLPLVIGSAYSGISIGYGTCLTSDILLLTVSFFCTGTSPQCAYIDVVPDPTAPTGKIEVVDCSFVKLVGMGFRIWFNTYGLCGGDCTYPIQDTTWGQVKALY